MLALTGAIDRGGRCGHAKTPLSSGRGAPASAAAPDCLPIHSIGSQRRRRVPRCPVECHKGLCAAREQTLILVFLMAPSPCMREMAMSERRKVVTAAPENSET